MHREYDSCLSKKGKFGQRGSMHEGGRGLSDSTVGRMLALHEADPDPIPSLPYGP